MYYIQMSVSETGEVVDGATYYERPTIEDIIAFPGMDHVNAARILLEEGEVGLAGPRHITVKLFDIVGNKWNEFQLYIDAITYKPGWYFRTGIEEGRMWVQVGVTEEAEISYDPIEGKKVPWRGRKHWLSKHMCRQEVVGIALYAVEQAEMHEVKEWFRYKGKSIYNPHLDPDVLVEVAKYKKNFNTRVNAMTMEEDS